MTATDTATATAAGITEEELAALQAGGWDDYGTDSPCWEREVRAESGEWTLQRVFPFIYERVSRWDANSDGETANFRNGIGEALAWCDKKVGGAKPDKPGSATEQEDRFALALAAS